MSLITVLGVNNTGLLLWMQQDPNTADHLHFSPTFVAWKVTPRMCETPESLAEFLPGPSNPLWEEAGET